VIRDPRHYGRAEIAWNKAAFEQIVGAAVKRQHEPRRVDVPESPFVIPVGMKRL
jgi:hypothetical protein